MGRCEALTARTEGHCHFGPDRAGNRFPHARQHLSKLRVSVGVQRYQQKGLGRNVRRRPMALAPESWYQSGNSYRELDRTYRRPNKFFHRWLNHPSYDLFWQEMVPYQKQFAHINIPVLTTAGYYGGDEVGALYY